jgi:hypothetical protein
MCSAPAGIVQNRSIADKGAPFNPDDLHAVLMQGKRLLEEEMACGS